MRSSARKAYRAARPGGRAACVGDVMALTHSFCRIPVPVTGIRQRRVRGAGEFFRPRDRAGLP
ncbi:hypothetical protein CN059_20750 [Sinorhizobium medicae]|nr:hypothetical protein CN192_29695 [Sinorhizobium medicae]RVI90017.1 hypothetical protein CN186_24910 [Sinorhizobium medicae]RVJ05911.1 hypothetical protein CN181_19470 [Sinorhizobium medicae]RVJ14840.1 hypothetical protein CN183_00115 [Sinorhizobium medicae]RVJ24679.1 hypothetical protein CN184_09785 [Sinorhizobium medicae]